MTTRHTTIDTELGQLTLVADRTDLTGLYFPHHWHRPARSTFGPWTEPGKDPLFGRVTAQLSEYLTGDRTEFELSTRTRGNGFEERVWALLRQIPYGTTTTYGALARELGAREFDDRALARDVGQAVGSNPLCVIVPCHRVIGVTGKLTGYAGGLARKQLLLEREHALPSAEPAAAAAR
jgi:methylated-DNA-[protein]-cysteine S-methyltransferase